MARILNLCHVILFTMVCLSLLEASDGQSNGQQSRSSRRRLRNRQSPRRGDGLPSHLQGAYLDAASAVTTTTTAAPPQEDNSMSADDPWHRFIPSTPTSSEVECHVEVVARRRQGGRCIRLGGSQRTAICQSGAHFAFAPSCDEILTTREVEDGDSTNFDD